MATTAASIQFIPVGEYLGSVYRPDVDYVDGRLEERNVGEFDHATLQGILYSLLKDSYREFNLRAKVEIRVQVAATRFRIPDVCLIPAGERDPIVTTAPALCVEILSPRDTVFNMRMRCADYLAMGVPEVWIFDPQTRKVYILSAQQMVEATGGTLELAGYPVRLSIEEIFTAMENE